LASDVVSGLQKINLLRRVETLPKQYLEKLRDGISNNQKLSASREVKTVLNEMLQERGLSTLSEQQAITELTDDDIPF